MPRIVPNQFTAVEWLTPEEEKEAATFTQLQKLYLMSLRAQAATAKINLKYDPTQHQQFLQEEAALTGKLDILNQLIGD